MSYQHGPEFDEAWDAAFQIDELNAKIAELEAIKPETLHQIKERDAELKKLRKAIERLNVSPRMKAAKPGRKHILDPIIDQAIKTVCSDDVGQVWWEMCRVAQLDSPPAPIVGFADGEIKYFDITGLDPNEPHYYTRKNLADKLGRQKRQVSAK